MRLQKTELNQTNNKPSPLSICLPSKFLKTKNTQYAYNERNLS